MDGRFAEFAVADARDVVEVPDAVSSYEAAPERVAIFGIGGLDRLALQYARIVGGTVIAVDIDDAELQPATELGADHVVNSAVVDPVPAIETLGGADVAVVLAVTPVVFEQAFASLRRGGRLVCVGLPPESEGRPCACSAKTSLRSATS